MSDICDEYQAYTFDSYRQCCERLEGTCPPKKTCQTLDYTPFIPNSNCSPEAWKWTYDSCWIDSVLYAMFVPIKISMEFSNMLDTINSSLDVNEKKIAYYMRNYLIGLYNPSWSENSDGKLRMIVCKTELSDALLDWNKSNGFIFNNSIDAQVQEHLFGRDKWDVKRGPQFVILEFFCNKFSDKINCISFKGQDLVQHCNLVEPKKLVKNIINKHLSTQTKDLIFIHLYDMQDCKTNRDRTRIEEIKNINNYELQSFVYGSNQHTRAAVLCNRNFISYDDMTSGKRTNNINNQDLIFNSAEEITLIYKKIKQDGGRKSKRNMVYRKKSIIEKDLESGRRKKSDKAKENRERNGKFSQKHVRIQEEQLARANQRNSSVKAEASGVNGK